MITYETPAQHIQKNRSTVKRHIQQLKDQDILQKEGSRKKGHWVILKKEKDLK